MYADGTSISGFWVTDTVCVLDDPNACVKDFAWCAADIADGLREREDGIMGMMYEYSEHSNALYVPELYAAGTISENVFSFYLTDGGTFDGETDTSYMDFGTPNTSVMSSEEDLIWIENIEYYGWWTEYVSGYRWKDMPDSESYYEVGVTPKPAITDTGTSCIYGPYSAVNPLVS